MLKQKTKNNNVTLHFPGFVLSNLYAVKKQED